MISASSNSMFFSVATASLLFSWSPIRTARAAPDSSVRKASPPHSGTEIGSRMSCAALVLSLLNWPTASSPKTGASARTGNELIARVRADFRSGAGDGAADLQRAIALDRRIDAALLGHGLDVAAETA